MHTPTRYMPMLLACLALALSTTSCSLLVSKKRQLKRYITNFNVAVAEKKNWKKAASYMSSSFTYTPYQGQAFQAGKASAGAYFKELSELKGTDYILTVNEMKPIGETKMAVTATRQVRAASAVETINKFWEVAMLWELTPDGKNWKLIELKQISEQRRARS